VASTLKPKSVYLVGDRQKGRTVEFAEELAAALRSRVAVVGIDTEQKQDLSQVKADVLLVLGGDGSILRAAQRLRDNPIPIVGVNFGHLGFLATVTPDAAAEQVAATVTGPLVIEERGCFSVAWVRSNGERVPFGIAVNDAVVDRGGGARLVTLGVTIDGKPAFETRGDGIVVSTPTGSTAYALAAGGPILHPELGVFLITPICAHSLTNRPIVLPWTSTVGIEVVNSDGMARLAIDGQTPPTSALRDGDRIELVRAKRVLRLAVSPDDDFYTRLRRKLHFARPAER
jgi:NAD+ kinase